VRPSLDSPPLPPFLGGRKFSEPEPFFNQCGFRPPFFRSQNGFPILSIPPKRVFSSPSLFNLIPLIRPTLDCAFCLPPSNHELCPPLYYFPHLRSNPPAMCPAEWAGHPSPDYLTSRPEEFFPPPLPSTSKPREGVKSSGSFCGGWGSAGGLGFFILVGFLCRILLGVVVSWYFFFECFVPHFQVSLPPRSGRQPQSPSLPYDLDGPRFKSSFWDLPSSFENGIEDRRFTTSEGPPVSETLRFPCGLVSPPKIASGFYSCSRRGRLLPVPPSFFSFPLSGGRPEVSIGRVAVW